MNLPNQSFIWLSLSPGKNLSGEIKAYSSRHVKTILKKQDIIPFIILKKRYFNFISSFWIIRFIKPFIQLIRYSQKIKESDIAVFFHQLATLITTGIPIVQSLEILYTSQDNILFKSLISTLKKEIETGKNFVTAIKKFPHQFDTFNCHLIHLGEQTGSLNKMLKRIANNKEKSIHLKNQIKQALFYPMIILITAFIITLIMLIFIVPRFAELFKNMNTPLPFITQITLSLSNFICTSYSFLIIPFLVMIAFKYQLKRSPSLRKQIDHLYLSAPFLKKWTQKIILIRFSQSLATLYSGGTPILEGLRIISQISTNSRYSKIITLLQMNVAKGKQLYASMSGIDFFPKMMTQMIKVGEETGHLDVMLEKVAQLYQKDLEYFISYLSRVMEPLIMIFLGVLIGGLVVAMYLPIFKLGTII